MNARAYKGKSLRNFADQDEKPASTNGDIMNFKAKPMAANDLPALSNVAVTLSQDAAAAFNSAFKVTAFVTGLTIDTGFARATLQYERH